MVDVERVEIDKLGENGFDKLNKIIEFKVGLGYTKFTFKARPLSDFGIMHLLCKEKCYVEEFDMDFFNTPIGVVDYGTAVDYWKEHRPVEFELTSTC